MTTKLNRIAVLLDVTPAQAEQFIQEVNRRLPRRMPYNDIYTILKSLPVADRKSDMVAIRLIQKHRLSSDCNEDVNVNATCQPVSQPGLKTITALGPVPLTLRSMVASVVGVSFDGRPALVARCRLGDQVILRREPHNPYDGNAIMVLTAAGQKIGYINRSLAARLAPRLDTHGKDVDGVVEYLFRHATGINRGIAIRFYMPDLP
jgi:HIRAN domain